MFVAAPSSSTRTSATTSKPAVTPSHICINDGIFSGSRVCPCECVPEIPAPTLRWRDDVYT